MSKKKILLLQIRPEEVASDNEFEAFVKFSGLKAENFQRVNLASPKGLEFISNLKLNNYSAVIVGGGPACISDDQSKKPAYQISFEPILLSLMAQILEDDFPFLGACYGIGLLAKSLNLPVSKEKYSEPVGAVEINLNPDLKDDKILADLDSTFQAFVGHKEAVQAVDDRLEVLASSTTCPYQLLKFKSNIYATQFHPELDVEGLTTRIKVYKNAGYFPPEQAEELIEQARQSDVHQAVKILENFCRAYCPVV